MTRVWMLAVFVCLTACDGGPGGSEAPADGGRGDECSRVGDWKDCTPRTEACEPCLALNRCRAHEHENGEAACTQAGCVVTSKLTSGDDELPYTCTPS